MTSPFIGIARFEKDHGLPPNYINISMYVINGLNCYPGDARPIERSVEPMAPGRDSNGGNCRCTTFTGNSAKTCQTAPTGTSGTAQDNALSPS